MRVHVFSFKMHCQNTSTAPTPQGVFPWNPSFGPHIPGRPLYPRLPSRNKFGVLAAKNMGWQLMRVHVFSFKKHCQNTSTAPTPQGVFPWNPSFGPHIPGRPLYPRLPSRNKFGVLAAKNMGWQLMRVHVFSFKKHCQNTSTAPTPQGVFPWNPSFGPHIPGRDLYPLLPSHNKFGVLAAKNMGWQLMRVHVFSF